MIAADDMGTSGGIEGIHAAGYNSILPKEHGNKMFNLPIVKYCEKDVSRNCGAVLTLCGFSL